MCTLYIHTKKSVQYNYLNAELMSNWSDTGKQFDNLQYFELFVLIVLLVHTDYFTCLKIGCSFLKWDTC